MFKTISNSIDIVSREFQFPVQKMYYDNTACPEKATRIEMYNVFGVKQMEIVLTLDSKGRTTEIKYYTIKPDGTLDTSEY